MFRARSTVTAGLVAIPCGTQRRHRNLIGPHGSRNLFLLQLLQSSCHQLAVLAVTESHPTDGTRLSLLERVREQDADGWRRLVTLYSPLLYAWCRRSGLEAEVAGDVVQEVFTKVARSIGDFRRDRPGDTFRGWLRTITRNQLRDLARRQAREPRAEGGTSAHLRMEQAPGATLDLPSESESEAEHGLLFRRAINLIQKQFQEPTWRAFWQTVVEGRASADVADDLGMSPGAVRQAKSKVLARLRAEFGDVLELPE